MREDGDGIIEVEGAREGVDVGDGDVGQDGTTGAKRWG